MIKKILILTLFFYTILNAKVNAIVSIEPEFTFVKAIGGGKVNVKIMIKQGNSPHTYEPKPSQMRDVSKADIYFAIGVEFEDVWLKRFQNLNKKMLTVKIDKNINKIYMAGHDKHEEHSGGKDPHIWTAPSNVKVIAQNIYNNLIKIDEQNKEYYKNNFDKFIKKINKTDKKIQNIFANKNRKFMVIHPSWGYFAKEYNLIQMPIEIEGKEPKPKDLAKLMSIAKEEEIKTIFTQPEFSDKSAKIIANELNIKVVKITPLDLNWSQNLINLAKTIANQ